MPVFGIRNKLASIAEDTLGGGDKSPKAARDPAQQRLDDLEKAKSQCQSALRKDMLAQEGTMAKLAGKIMDHAVMDDLESLIQRAGAHGASSTASDAVAVPWAEYAKNRGTAGSLAARLRQDCGGEYGKYFDLAPHYLDGASGGPAPCPVLHGRAMREKVFQTNPVYWRFTTLQMEQIKQRSKVAQFIGTDNDYLSVVPNVEAAINTVLKSLPWKAGDRLLLLSVEEETTLLACAYLSRTYGVEVVSVPVGLPMSDEEVIKAVEAKLKAMKGEQGGLPVFASICHVVPKSGWVLPAKKLVKLLHSSKVSVMVDGSQALGNLEKVQLRDIGADWYVGTCHNWMYSCAGVAWLVAKPHKQSCTFPQTVSYFDGKGYVGEFSYYGLQDWMVCLSAMDGLEFVDNACGGWSKVWEYCKGQVNRIPTIMGQEWQGLSGPQWVSGWPNPVQGSYEKCGRLPLIALPWAGAEPEATQQQADTVTAALMSQGVTACIVAVPVNNRSTLCVRCTVQVYTDDEDWRALAKAIRQFNGAYPAQAARPEVIGAVSASRPAQPLWHTQQGWTAKLRKAFESQPGGGHANPAQQIPDMDAVAAPLLLNKDAVGVNWGAWGQAGPSEFGTEAFRKKYFHLGPFFLNAASYGATPKAVLEGRQRIEQAFHANPTTWRVAVLPRRWDDARRRLAAVLGATPDHLQILPNANAATNAVLKSLPWQVGDRILIFSVEYDATTLACNWLNRTYGVETVKLDLQVPMTDDQVCAAFEQKLAQMAGEPGGLPTLVNFCHVTSKTAWIFPARRLVQICRARRVTVMVDGAQAAGHLDFRINDVDADWYIGTVHKWMYSCPGVAFMCAKPHKQVCTFPQTVSTYDGQGFVREFSYYGVQDWSTWLCLTDGLDFVDRVCGGWQQVRGYCSAQAQRCASVCKAVWDAKKLKGPKWLPDWPQPVQGEGRFGQMPIIPLPWKPEEEAAGGEAGKVMGSLMTTGLTGFTMVIKVNGKNTLCIRCACQLYTGDADWKAMAECVADFKGSYGAGEAVKDAAVALQTMIGNKLF